VGVGVGVIVGVGVGVSVGVAVAVAVEATVAVLVGAAGAAVVGTIVGVDVTGAPPGVVAAGSLAVTTDGMTPE
jgi:hypothetical protein